ncbi:MAG: DUF692 domain-containing protein, partial [Oleiphilaceae bacterium]|nr:DUF692 domain-containing protein [Oleiphilaceae bacterium]
MMSVPPIHSPELSGAGIGIRSAHYSEVLETLPQVPWFEALTDNYLNPGGRPLAMLDQIRKHYPVTLHGVGMSLGGTAPLCEDYLQALKSLIARIAPAFISDHLCWNQHQGRFGNDLFPLPYTREAINHIVPRIQYVQEYLGRSILIENVSSYLSYQCSEMTEAEFL